MAFLERKRSEGFSIVAAEQTTKSVPLEKFQFPARSLILMGDEKEGVPAHLLRYVDYTVEITQLGHTRSLNVHVSAALFIYQYAAQRLINAVA